MSAGEAAFVFLRSPEGRAMVVRALQRRGLPLGLHDDLVSEVLRRVLTAEQRETIENPAGFATNAAQYAAADLLRGERRRPAPLLPTRVSPDGDEVDVDIEADVVIDDDVLAKLALRDLRDALFDAALLWPSRVATALAFLTARVDDAPVSSSCPQPAGGAGALEAAEWAGLWYGGRDDCFPSKTLIDSALVRKRRSRAIAQMHDTLLTAAREAEVVDERP